MSSASPLAGPRPTVLAGLTAVGVLVLTLLGASSATASTVTSVESLVAQLQAEQVVLADDARVPLDVDAARDAVRSSEVQIYVAGVSAATAERAGGDAALTTSLGRGIGDSSAVVLLITDAPSVYADNGTDVGDRGVNAGQALRDTPRGQFDEAGVTDLVRDFAAAVDAQAVGGGSSTAGGLGLLPLLAVGAAGVGGYVLLSSRRAGKRRAQQLEDLRADVESLYGRLGSDVQLLAPGDDPVTRQALADASERYTATGALLAKADTPGEFAAARRTAVEGIAAARVVRERLGLDPGPDVPLPEGAGPQLTEPSRVQIGEQEYEGSPSYQPGRPHYYEGGYYGGQPVPGGWYATPFWQTLLMGSVLSGGLGGHGPGTGYGSYGRRRGGGVFMGGGGLGGGGLGGLGGGRGGRRRGGGGFGGFGGGGSWGGGGRRGGRGGGGSW